MRLSSKISDNQIHLLVKDYIKFLLLSHRNTECYQIETEKFDGFSKNQILKNLTKNSNEVQFLEQQFDFINSKNSDWNKDFFSDLAKINFLSKAEILNNKLVHFRLSVPLITMDKSLIIIKTVYQNSYSQGEINGSDSIELFRINELNKLEYLGLLFGTSI